MRRRASRATAVTACVAALLAACSQGGEGNTSPTATSTELVLSAWNVETLSVEPSESEYAVPVLDAQSFAEVAWAGVAVDDGSRAVGRDTAVAGILTLRNTRSSPHSYELQLSSGQDSTPTVASGQVVLPASSAVEVRLPWPTTTREDGHLTFVDLSLSVAVKDVTAGASMGSSALFHATQEEPSAVAPPRARSAAEVNADPTVANVDVTFAGSDVANRVLPSAESLGVARFGNVSDHPVTWSLRLSLLDRNATSDLSPARERAATTPLADTVQAVLVPPHSQLDVPLVLPSADKGLARDQDYVAVFDARLSDDQPVVSLATLRFHLAPGGS